MKKMKLFASLAVVAAMVLSLAACGGGSSAPAADSGSGDAAGGEKITLIMSQRDEFLSSLEAGAVAKAKELGVNLVTQDANSDQNKVVQYVQTAAADGQKAVIVNVVDPTACGSVIEAAGDMKVVFVNRVPDDTSILNENAVYVGSDEHTSGKFQGDFLAEYFKAQGKTDIKYILLNGIIGQTSTTLRTESVLKALADGGINATETTAPLAAMYDRNKAIDMITPVLSDKSKQFDCIISNNDAMACGAIEACESANIDPSTFPIVGIDCTKDGAAAVNDGKMLMTVFQNPEGQGVGAVEACKNLINGKPANEGTQFTKDESGESYSDSIIWIPFEPVTKDNVADYM